MERWILAAGRSRYGARYYLANRSRTLITIKSGLKFTPEALFVRLQEIGFPIAYTNGLDLIKFTILTGPQRGWYGNDQVEVDVSAYGQEEILETFVHEVGHHVDEQEDASLGLQVERVQAHRHLRRRGAYISNPEYLAVGFERFYSGNPNDRKRMRKHNPLLYRAINRLHCLYSSRS